MAAITTTSSSANINDNSCGVGFFNFRSNSMGSTAATRGVRPLASCSKLDGVAMWLINGVAAAFFASMEGCSCIRITTVDDAEDGNDAPLILHDGNGGGGRRRRRSKGKKQATMLYGGF